MAEPMVIDVDEPPKGKATGSEKRKTGKRKRVELTAEEKSGKIGSLKGEMKSLNNFYWELIGNKENENLVEGSLNSSNNNNVDSVIAVLIEESRLPLSKLVVEIFEKLKGKFRSDSGAGGGLSSLASVKSRVLLIGQRVFYGVSDSDADLLEDDSESALWCWETRDMKLLPKSMRVVLKSRRTCRKKIQERINAVFAMLAALERQESHQNYQELMKASERLGKTLKEEYIRLLVDKIAQENVADGSIIKGRRQEEKLLIKQLEKNKREEEKEKKRIERELQKVKLQNEKELRRLQDEAEKEEKRREKEESEMNRLKKRNQEEAEKDQRRREKEEAEKRKQLSLLKQASLMDRFLKRGKSKSASESDQSPSVATDPSPKTDKENPESITRAMDSVLSINNDFKVEDIWNLHLKSWHRLGNSIRSNGHMHWGIRRKPKTELGRELKLTANKGMASEEDMNIVNLVDGWGGSSTDSRLSATNSDCKTPYSQIHIRSKQLLQFDKSHRPAFYGVRLKKSEVVSGRHPFVKDPELDYEIDSDEEWEEEEPGESLSDCEKDGEEESLDEGCSRGDDDESEDGFFVPDGYLSDDEGVEVDKMVAHLESSSPGFKESLPSEAVNQLFRQQKYLYNLTEHALRKNQPLVVLNIMHQKAPLLSADNVTGAEKLEQMCLQALSICAFPDGPSVHISIIDDKEEDQGACMTSTKTSSMTSACPAILDSDMPQIVSVIHSCPGGINKVVDSLHEKFPTISRSQLRNKVREISDFVDNRWQVKKDVLVKLGLTISPEKGSGTTKSIVTFFSKRCLPPSGKSINPYETSPQASQKPASSSHQQEVTAAQEH